MSEEREYDSMDRGDYEYSIASQIAYDYYDNGSDAEATQRILDTYLDGYTFDPENSYNDASTIVRPDGSAILAYRGTRPTNPIDLIVDAGILVGTHRAPIPAPSFIQAQNHYNQVKNVYNNLDITGHSRGGTWANYIARENGEKAVVFNPGESPLGFNSSKPSNTRVYRTNTFDLVSISTHAYSDYNDIRTIPQSDPMSSWLGSHNLTNFLPTIDMLPLSTEPDVIIPNIPLSIPKQLQREEKQIDTQFEVDICKQQPYLFQCKKPKLKQQKKRP
tara:strand:- start:24 stop:848 length:825 start_codon:yes stop_codon:yes gene_type:complete